MKYKLHRLRSALSCREGKCKLVKKEKFDLHPFNMRFITFELFAHYISHLRLSPQKLLEKQSFEP